MTFLDLLDLYAFQHDSSDCFLMLQDYTLDSRIDREIFNKVLIKDLGGMVPTSNTPGVFKFLLETFFQKWKYGISKELDTMYLTYNTIYNVDIKKTRDDVADRDTDSTDIGTLDSTVEGTRSAYDASTYQPVQKTITDTDTTDTYHQDVAATLDRDETEVGHRPNHTFQELINEERELSEFNIYDWILERMRKELFLLVY